MGGLLPRHMLALIELINLHIGIKHETNMNDNEIIQETVFQQ